MRKKISSRKRVSSEPTLGLKAKKILEGTPLKVTKGRLAIVKFLLKEHGPFRIEEIHQNVEGLDLVTVYRTLSSLEELDLVKRVILPDSLVRFEWGHRPEHDHHGHHHHVLCTSCQKIESFHDCTIGQLEAQVARLGYSQIRHSLEFFGLCKSCTKAAGA